MATNVANIHVYSLVDRLVPIGRGNVFLVINQAIAIII